MQLSDAVLAEDLCCLADSSPLDGPTRRLLEQAADRLERLEAIEHVADLWIYDTRALPEGRNVARLIRQGCDPDTFYGARAAR